MEPKTIIMFIIGSVVILWVLAVFLKSSGAARLATSLYAPFILGFAGAFLRQPNYSIYLATILTCVVAPALVGSVLRWFSSRAKTNNTEADRVASP